LSGAAAALKIFAHYKTLFHALWNSIFFYSKMMRTLIKNATIVNEGRAFAGSVIIDDDLISDVFEGGDPPVAQPDSVVDLSGCLLLPGVIDEHVHFREPGLTRKACIESESRAAAYGGVTTYFDMPNTVPQTTTLEALEDKLRRGASESHVNYSFFFGVTNDNTCLLGELDRHRVPGVKLFMGSSTGNMLVDKRDALERVFASAGLPIMAHCEDSSIIARNAERAVALWGADPDIARHPVIRSAEACFESTRLAVELARKHGARLHVAHVSTARELSLFERAAGRLPEITAEAVVAHLLFTDSDYTLKGAMIKCNPAVKTFDDREALRHALADGRISAVGTDHAPHELSDKQGGSLRAASGMPMVQFSLVSMLRLVDEGIITVERLVELMCHNPARLFSVRGRGFIRKGFKADLVAVRRGKPWTVTKDLVQSKCGWSPLEGETFSWRVEHTFCNGRHIYDNGVFDAAFRGEEVAFR